MQVRDIIVVGASAGGLDALKLFVSSFSADFQGSIFVVLHIPPSAETTLPAILTRAGNLEAMLAKDGGLIEPGKIYIAPNDHHLLLSERRTVVKKGPKENRFRPSIDALFRSAAYVFGTRVIGVILSGVMNDGTSGLWSINRLGGITMIQDPDEAEQPQMPLNVLEYTDVDYTLGAGDMGSIISGLMQEPAPERYKFSMEELKLLKTEVIIATRGDAFEMGIMEMGELTPFTCPECHGVLVRLVEGRLIRFRCHTGHAYTSSSLLADVSKSVEEKLWQSMRGMEEMTMLLRQIAKHYGELGDETAANLFKTKSEKTAEQARIIHDSIFKQEQYSEDLRLVPRLKGRVGKVKPVK